MPADRPPPLRCAYCRAEAPEPVPDAWELLLGGYLCCPGCKPRVEADGGVHAVRIGAYEPEDADAR